MPSHKAYLVQVPTHIPSHRTYPVQVHLICPAIRHTQFKITSYVQPQNVPSPILHLIYPAKEYFRFCSRCHYHAHNVTVHLHSDVDIHPHHHLHSTRPIISAGCSPCSPLFRMTYSFYPPTGGLLERGTREPSLPQSTPAGQYFCLSQ